MDKKEKTINLINKKDKCFQYVATVTLNHEEIKKDLERMRKIKSFMEKYNWQEIVFPSEKDDWKKIEENNLIFAVNVLYA